VNDDARQHLVKLLGMLGSAHDGERAAAGLKADQFVKRHGLRWTDVIIATPPQIGWRGKVHACAAHIHSLNATERSFVRTMLGWVGTPSDKQLAWIDRIYANLPA
jgi:hypothetical protein